MQWLLIALLVIARQGLGSPAVDINSLSPLSTDDAAAARLGRCPTKTLDPSQCPARDRAIDTDECHSDDDCSGESKCCSDGCRRVCIMPLLTSCERQRVETVKRARALHQSENEISLPACDRVGDYEPVQCDPVTGNCFCVDESGFEMAGTRARSLELVNCTNPKPCAGLLCRMLCPYEFELDDEGCPRCECRDPCRGIKCPGSQTCQLENMPCAKEPCRPVPTCKQSRSIESLCPAGTPLTMPGGDRLFLCGNQVGQPKCPELFECIVSPGNDYGACCTAADRLTKPGSCPAVNEADNSTVCGVPCENDMQCHGSDKCCSSGPQCTSDTGLHCVPPQNFSLCLQQQRIAQLLTIAERKDKGYIPQCDPTNGDRFFNRQCSRNGLVCWCVDPDRGTTIQGTMGPADEVVCDGQSNAVARALRCESTICSITCDYGFKSDERGCPSCECADPCDQITCASGKECVMKPDESCPHGAKPSNCLFRPECRNVFVPPCAHGRHLTNQATDEAIQCTVGSKFACPTGYHCTYSLPNNASYCCPEAGPVSKHDIPEIDGRLPSICEIMRDVAEGRRQAESGYRLALKSSRCNAKGDFEEVQCEGEECWCVDEFGVELADTRGPKEQCTEPFCHKMRQDVESECPGLLCRLGCDYGFTNDNKTGCPMCECRNPCDLVKCAAGETCQMVVQQCDESPFCPALPYCVSLQRSSIEDDTVMPTCPAGEPLVNDASNSPVKCNTRGRSVGCPSGYTCHSDDGNSSGVCCPIQRQIKAGQCPYLVPVSVDSCDSECTSDEDCDGQLKCCSNGCGTQCVDPILKTACQHAQMVAKYTARSMNKPAHRMFIPRCRPEDGAFEPVQCDPITRACWCVTSEGLEVAGTRVPPGLQPQCHSPRRCPVLSECADLECPHGREIDTSGCPTCACRDPCDKVHCRPGVEECRLVQLNCVGEPCPPQPLCLPPLDNPCSYGQPLKDAANRTSECGPMGSSCPSTHKCHLSPLGEFSVCCPKPRDVCFQEKASGSCKASQLRWSFNERRNRCEAFRFSGCGGNMNNFDSERDCQAVCPSLSSCEELREKNLKLAEKYKKVVFTPKCNRVNGDWEPVQCLEEVGVCWCVDKDGEHIKGTLTRGVPVCGVRQARHHAVDPPICDDPKAVVHACNKSICDGKICLASPRAVCRVDPCGGCRHAFYDPASGRKVDCQSGLTQCQKEVQTVLNSEAWARQGGPWGFQPVTSLFNYQHSLDSYAGRVVLEKDAEILPDDVLTSVTVLGSRLKRQTFEEATATETATVLDALIDDLAQVGPSELLAALAQESATETVEEATEIVPVLTEATRQPKKLDHSPIDQGLLDGEVSSIQTLDDEKPISQRPLPALRDAIKPGFCPPVHSRTYLRVLAQFAGASVCADQCLSDADCDGPSRCCPSECGSACTNPIILPTPLLPKPGFCPAIKYQEGCPAGLEATNECSMDADCSGKAKCCFNGCYSSCSQPQEESTGPLVMSLSPPVCTLKGDYAREQSHGELSWCVDANGHPIDDSFTRGSVRCSPNGTVLEQRALGPVCQDPNVQPMVCRDECMRARCPFHPDAICVADPCNKCAVSFVDAAGNPLQCSDRCTMPAETGFCRALFPRYFYNATSETCEEFIFGGCDGNENNFETVEDCRNECEKPDHVCELPMETGLCRASIARWFYNAATQQCEKFMFGGCGGNANNFYSYEQCANRCPDLVVCPKQAATGEMKTCSRHQACRGKTCRGYPDAKCSVDPCTCSPVFVDIDDQPLECLPGEPEVAVESRHAKLGVASNEEPSATTTTTSTTTTTTTEATTTTTAKPSTTSISPSPRGKAIEHAHYTRCQKMRQAQLKKEAAGASDNFVYECDHLGRFQPIQCMPAKTADGQTSTPRCWCVDEAGNQVPNTTQFNRGERTCRLVPVMSVAVTLGFPTMDHSPSELEREVRYQMADILNGLSARTVEETLEIVTREDGTILYFTLVGDNKIDVASHLEDMVKSGHLTLDMHGHSMPADMSTSKFHHKLDSVPKAAHHDMSFTDRILETKEILSQALDIEAPYLAVIVVLSVLASILVCGLIIGLVLHHRRTTGMYPKGAQTLASSPKQRKNASDKMEVIPRGFPRVGINPSDVVHTPQLSPTIPRSKRQNRNADAW